MCSSMITPGETIETVYMVVVYIIISMYQLSYAMYIF